MKSPWDFSAPHPPPAFIHCYFAGGVVAVVVAVAGGGVGVGVALLS